MLNVLPVQKIEPFKPELRITEAFDNDYLDPRVMRCFLALMDHTAVQGGAACHWGGPSALSELVSSLFKIMSEQNDWPERYNIVNDIGHAENIFYVAKALYGHAGVTIEELRSFRKFKSRLTGHGESHLFAEGVLLSNGPLSSAVAQSQGLAMADKLTNNARTTVCFVSDGACMEGEAKESLASIPGIYSKMNPYVLVISDNERKLSGPTDSAYTMQTTFQSLEHLGWEVQKVNGHAQREIDQAFEAAFKKASQKPQAIWAKTIKGKGLDATEKHSSGGHGYPLKATDFESLENYLNELKGSLKSDWLESEINSWLKFLKNNDQSENKTEAALKNELKHFNPEQVFEKIQVGVSKALADMATEFPVVSLSSDLPGSTGVANFQKEFPGLSFDMGIAESNMINAAAGMSRLGFIPVVDTFSAFGVTKGNLPLIMAQLSNCPLIAFFSHTGFQDAADGASHQSTTYLSALSSIPNLKTYSLSSSVEAYDLVCSAVKEISNARAAKNHHCPTFVFFLGRENFPQSYTGVADKPTLLSAQKLTNGKQATLVTHGSLVPQALRAYELLKKEGVEIAIINSPQINNVDVENISLSLSQTNGVLFTLEDHQVKGGAGEQLLAQLMLHGTKVSQWVPFGIEGHFGMSAYKAEDLYEWCQLDGVSIAQRIKEKLTSV